MEFSNSLRAEKYLNELRDFMEQQVLPAEPIYHQQRTALIAAGKPHDCRMA